MKRLVFVLLFTLCSSLYAMSDETIKVSETVNIAFENYYNTNTRWYSSDFQQYMVTGVYPWADGYIIELKNVYYEIINKNIDLVL